MSAADARRAASTALGAAEGAPSLTDLVDGPARQLLEEASYDLGVPLHLVATSGAVLLGLALPSEVEAQAGSTLTPVDVAIDGACRRWLVREVAAGGRTLGCLAVGPFAPAAEPEVRRVATHLARLVDHAVGAAAERLVALRHHSASLEHAYGELQQKNARLAAAVERLQELDKVKSSFLATVSHELRTPLTSVIGYSEMLLEGLAGPLNDEQTEYVRTVMEKGDQLLGIITGLLDISRIEGGGVKLDRSQFALDEVVDVALSTVAPTVRRKRLAVRKELAPSLPRVHADRDKVRQVLINLVGNAVKFTPEGGEIRVSAEVAPLRRPSPCEPDAQPAPDERRGLRVAVLDSGIGIPAAAMGQIFDPFFQVDASSTREYGGTGLGLAIVKSFVHAHGGSVWVESTPGKGSAFYVTLPLAG